MERSRVICCKAPFVRSLGESRACIREKGHKGSHAADLCGTAFGKIQSCFAWRAAFGEERKDGNNLGGSLYPRSPRKDDFGRVAYGPGRFDPGRCWEIL